MTEELHWRTVGLLDTLSADGRRVLSEGFSIAEHIVAYKPSPDGLQPWEDCREVQARVEGNEVQVYVPKAWDDEPLTMDTDCQSATARDSDGNEVDLALLLDGLFPYEMWLEVTRFRGVCRGRGPSAWIELR